MAVTRHLDKFPRKPGEEQVAVLSRYGIPAPPHELHARLSAEFIVRGNDFSNDALAPEQRASMLKDKQREMACGRFSYKGRPVKIEYVFARARLDPSVVRQPGAFQAKIRIEGNKNSNTVGTDKLYPSEGDGLKESA
jgi:hypothetical protein